MFYYSREIGNSRVRRENKNLFLPPSALKTDWVIAENRCRGRQRTTCQYRVANTLKHMGVKTFFLPRLFRDPVTTFSKGRGGAFPPFPFFAPPPEADCLPPSLPPFPFMCSLSAGEANMWSIKRGGRGRRRRRPLPFPLLPLIIISCTRINLIRASCRGRVQRAPVV